MLLDAIKNYIRALPEGVPGFPTAEGIRNIMEYDVTIPRK